MDLGKPLLQSWRTRTGKEELRDEEKGDSSGEPIPKLQKSYFDVLGICCSSEISLVESILRPINGVKDVSVIVVSRTVIVVHDSHLISSTQIMDVLNKARLEASIKGSGEGLVPKKKWPSPYAIASGSLLLLSLFEYVYDPLKWVALGAVAAGIFPIILKGVSAIRHLRIDINILALSAVIGTIVLKEYIEAGTIVFLFSIAQWLESKASHKATAAMSSLMGMAPKNATIAETGEVVDVHEIQLNTVLAVKPGEVIPMDGVVVDGISEVDEKTLTGESFPVAKLINSPVWAGTINLNGYLSVRTTALAEDCVVAQMAKLVEEAQSKKSETQRFIDAFAKFYTPAVLVISISFVVIPVALGVPNRDHWLRLALVVLVSACPCALILSTPVATFCALTKAAEHGLLIKGGDYLETLGKIKIVAFDKTGTITRGEFSVSEFRSLHTEISLETILYWVSSIESKSSHPMAAPLVQHAKFNSIEPRPEDVEDFQNFPGEGIYGKIDGKDVFVGNKRIAVKAGSENVPVLHAEAIGGKTVGYVYVGATLVGIFSLSDECRTGVAEAIEQLKSLHIKTVMLTGDTQEAAVHAQNKIHNALDLVYAELLPEEKLKIIEELKKDGLTAMVGDGINDAPSLAASDIGISMGISGSALAVETGHVILMSNDIGKIPRAVILARRGQRKVIENVLISVLTKGAILALAFAGYPLVWAAVLADTGTCLIVVLNSMLLLRENKGDRPVEEPCRRLPVPIEENPTADEISLGQYSSLLPQGQVLDSRGKKVCCKSGKCALEQQGLQEKVTCESKQDETKAVSCTSRSCCSEVSDTRTKEVLDAGIETVQEMKQHRPIIVNQNIQSSGSAYTNNGSGFKDAELVGTNCCSRGRCSNKKDSVEPRLDNMEQSGPLIDDIPKHSAENATSIRLESKSSKSPETGCCSQGRCNKIKVNAPTAELTNTNVSGKSVSEHMELTQRGLATEPGHVLLKNDQTGGCCKKSYGKESCGKGCCLTEVVTI